MYSDLGLLPREQGLHKKATSTYNRHFWRCFAALDIIEYVKWTHIHVINLSNGNCEAWRKIFPYAWFLSKTQFPTYYWTLLMFLQGLVAQMNMMPIQAFRIKLLQGLLLSDSSQFISLKKTKYPYRQKFTQGWHLCAFLSDSLSAWWFLIILPIELFHYIIRDFSRHFHNLLGVSFLNIL